MSSSSSPRRHRRSSSELRRAILSAAAGCYADLGFSGATTSAIANKAETTEAQIFRYFPSKAELFREAITGPLEEHLRRFMAGLSQPEVGRADQREQAALYVRELQAFIAEHLPLLRSLLTAGFDQKAREGGLGDLDLLQEYFALGAQTMHARSDDESPIAPELIVRISFAAVLSNALFADWLYPGNQAVKEEIDEAVIRFVVDGVYPGHILADHMEQE